MLHMRCTALLGLLAVLVITLEDAEAKMTIPQVVNMLKPMKKACVQKTGVDEALLDGMKEGRISDDPKIMCYYSCLFKQLKALNKEGIPNVDNMIKQMEMMLPADETTDRLKAMLLKCKEEVTSTETCEASWQLSSCFYKTDPEVCFFP